VGKMQVTARVDGEIVADGVFTYSMVDLEEGNQEVAAGRIVDLEGAEP